MLKYRLSEIELPITPNTTPVAKKLPNYNCGSCGYAGCKAMAEAIVTGKEENLKKCKPGKEDLNFKPIIEYLNEHPNEDGTKVKVHL